MSFSDLHEGILSIFAERAHSEDLRFARRPCALAPMPRLEGLPSQEKLARAIFRRFEVTLLAPKKKKRYPLTPEQIVRRNYASKMCMRRKRARTAPFQ